MKQQPDASHAGRTTYTVAALSGDARTHRQAAAPLIPLSALRTLGLVLCLMLVIAGIVILVCTIIGAAGSVLINAGMLTLEHLIAPQAIVAVIVLGSVIIAIVVSCGIDTTIVQPLRRMTRAMENLARGDFSYRLEVRGRFHIREVDEFARAFNTAAAELGSTEMMRESFISDFSHEFRTPINSLCGFAQLLRTGDLTPEEHDEYLGIIIDESQRLAGLSERILSLTKIEHVAILPEVAPVDIAEQLRRVAIMLEPKWSRKDVAVNVAVDPCTIEGNADYLMQLWENIIDNAIKFSPEGGTVSVALYGGRSGEEGRVSAADEAVCWISDEGCGMDAETREHLFDRFYQGDTSHASEGSGVGLALCRRIVDLHGGNIEVQSAPGEGSVFEVRLPLKQS